jgi:hypothetical protein
LAKEILESIDGLIDSWVRTFNNSENNEIKELASENITFYTNYRERIFSEYPKLRPKDNDK